MFATRTRLHTASLPDANSTTDSTPRQAAWLTALLGTLIAFCLFWNADLRDLGPEEARIGLASLEKLGPLGIVYGQWNAALWPLQVLPAWVITQLTGQGIPHTGSVRWPVIAAYLMLLLLGGRSLKARFGLRPLLWFGLIGASMLGFLDRAWPSFDLLSGLAVAAAIDRRLDRGWDFLGGCLAAMAFLAGGWPPLLAILLVAWILPLEGRRLTWFLPVILSVAAWVVWIVRVAGVEPCAAALAWPLTSRPEWFLLTGLLAQGLPWTPIAALAFWPRVRAIWSRPGRRFLADQFKVTLVLGLAGTLIPGMAPVVRAPLLLILAMCAAASFDAGLRSLSSVRWPMLSLTNLVAIPLVVLVVPLAVYLGAAIPFYRPVAITVGILAILSATAALAAWIPGRARLAAPAWILAALVFKVAHAAVFLPEWNYRAGQGPWGRAIGQWLPAQAEVLSLVRWPDDLAFYIGRPVRFIPHEAMLNLPHPTMPDRPRYVLLARSEFDHWPDSAPRLALIREFQDNLAGSRVLARVIPGHPESPAQVASQARSDRVPDLH
jgi:hypothetical protein